jgi:hypothetical protein
MNRSTKIKVITAIADSLAKEEEWSVINLTLQHFDLPCTESWGNIGKKDYVIYTIQNASEQTLIDLGHHLGVDLIDGFNTPPISYATVMELMHEIEAQKALMISVATGGAQIQQVNNEYIQRQLSIVSKSKSINLDNPNRFNDLWLWYGKWSDGSLPSYQSRRNYISELYRPLVDKLLNIEKKKDEEIKPTGWERVDRSIDKIVQNLATAKNEEDFQSVGLLCREAIISLAQAIYNSNIHPSLDGTNPSETDAKRMLESFISATLAGNANEELRKYAKDAYQLSVVLQHRRTANFQIAAICVEATRSLVNIISIISGIRDP